MYNTMTTNDSDQKTAKPETEDKPQPSGQTKPSLPTAAINKPAAVTPSQPSGGASLKYKKINPDSQGLTKKLSNIGGSMTNDASKQ